MAKRINQNHSEKIVPLVTSTKNSRLVWRGVKRLIAGLLVAMLLAWLTVVLLMLAFQASPERMAVGIKRSFWWFTAGFWALVAVGFFLWPRLCRVIAVRWDLSPAALSALIHLRWRWLVWMVILEMLFAFDQFAEAIQHFAAWF